MCLSVTAMHLYVDNDLYPCKVVYSLISKYVKIAYMWSYGTYSAELTLLHEVKDKKLMYAADINIYHGKERDVYNTLTVGATVLRYNFEATPHQLKILNILATEVGTVSKTLGRKICQTGDGIMMHYQAAEIEGRFLAMLLL